MTRLDVKQPLTSERLAKFLEVATLIRTIYLQNSRNLITSSDEKYKNYTVTM